MSDQKTPDSLPPDVIGSKIEEVETKHPPETVAELLEYFYNQVKENFPDAIIQWDPNPSRHEKVKAVLPWIKVSFKKSGKNLFVQCILEFNDQFGSGGEGGFGHMAILPFVYEMNLFVKPDARTDGTVKYGEMRQVHFQNPSKNPLGLYPVLNMGTDYLPESIGEYKNPEDIITASKELKPYATKYHTAKGGKIELNIKEEIDRQIHQLKTKLAELTDEDQSGIEDISPRGALIKNSDEHENS